MATFIHGIAASENIDSSGEIISISGMDISSLEKDGVFNWEHKADQPGQVVGKILKAKKVFSDQDCEDEHQLFFFKKCGVPYLYVMGELMDDFKDSAKEVAGMFQYDLSRKEQNERNVANFSIEGAKIPNAKEGMLITRSIARKVTITVTPCNKAAIATMVPIEKRPKKGDIDELFKTEAIEIEIFKGEIPTLKKDQPKLTVAAPSNPLGHSIGNVGKLNVMSHAKPASYAGASHQELKAISDVHFNEAGKAKTAKAAQHHTAQAGWFRQASQRLEARQTIAPKAPSMGSTGPKTTGLFDPDMSGKMTPPGPIKKALDAGSGMAAPSALVGGAALAKQSLMPKMKPQNVARPNTGHGAIIHKPAPAPKMGKVLMKSKWLARAEEEYAKWSKKEEFESFMAKRMPGLTKGEVKAIGQTLALNKSMTMEKMLSSLIHIPSPRLMSADPMNKAAGKDSIFTLILFDGCDLHDILHCSHFATDDASALDKMVVVCQEYFAKSPEAKELTFDCSGELGKHGQPVLFLTAGDPYKDLFDKLNEVAKYKYEKFRPHVSVTSNVDTFKGKASSIVISVNGEVKHKFSFPK